MIVILNFTSLDLTDEQRQQIVASIVEQCDKRFISVYPTSRVYNVRPRASVQETMDAIPLTPAQWRQYAVIPFIQPEAGPLLDAVNKARGMDWPVVRARG